MNGAARYNGHDSGSSEEVTMDPIEPSPRMDTYELQRRIRREFGPLIKSFKDRKQRDWSTLHFVEVDQHGQPDELTISFLYQGGLAHALIFGGSPLAFLEAHLELVHYCSELFHRLLAEHVRQPTLMQSHAEWEATEQLREETGGARLVVSATTARPRKVTITFHPD